MKFLLTTILLITACASVCGQEETRSAPSVWERSIVTIEIARQNYDYYQPWNKRTKRLKRAGVVAAERQILSTADELFDRTLVRVQKNGRGRWWLGEVAWIDYHANLAIISVADDAFWNDLKPA